MTPTTCDELRRAVSLMVEKAIEGGHVLREPAPTIDVGLSEDGAPRAVITATLAGKVSWVPVSAVSEHRQEEG